MTSGWVLDRFGCAAGWNMTLSRSRVMSVLSHQVFGAFSIIYGHESDLTSSFAKVKHLFKLTLITSTNLTKLSYTGYILHIPVEAKVDLQFIWQIIQ